MLPVDERGKLKKSGIRKVKMESGEPQVKQSTRSFSSWKTFACIYVPGSTLHAPPTLHSFTPCTHFSLSLAVTAAHRGRAAHLGQVKWSCLVCSVPGSACVAGWGGEGVAGLRFTAGIRHARPHMSPAILLITRADCLTKSEQRLRPREKVLKPPRARTQED